jgi:hypothetical protein
VRKTGAKFGRIRKRLAARNLAAAHGAVCYAFPSRLMS